MNQKNLTQGAKAHIAKSATMKHCDNISDPEGRCFELDKGAGLASTGRDRLPSNRKSIENYVRN